MLRQVRALGQVLANQAVDVLVTAALPRTLRIAKVNRHTRLLGQFDVFGHLTPLVIRHAFTKVQRHAVQRRTKTLDRRGRGGVAHFDQNQITTGAPNKRAHRRGIVLAFNQIAFPVAGHLPVVNLGRTHVNTHHVSNLAASINTATARPAGTFTLPQTHLRNSPAGKAYMAL